MSPTVRHDPATVDLDVVRRHRAPISARVYACTLLAVAILAVVVLAFVGEPLPLPGPVLLLAIPLALCMNRFVFFSNEVGITADAAVMFAAMVLFREDAVWLGPLAVALLVGPLDAKHWGDRAFVRMAYNSGSTALVTLAALGVFVSLTETWGASWWALTAAAAVAAVPYVLVESVFGIGLVSLLGERPSAAARHQLPLNLVALPLAIFGAVAGLAAVDVGWWIAFVLLLPAPLVPELVLVVLPRRWHRAGWSPAAPLVAFGLAGLGSTLLLPRPTAPAIVGLTAIACFVAAEHRPNRETRIPPLMALLVVVPAAAFPEIPPFAAILLGSGLGAAFLVIFVRPASRAAWCLPVIALAAYAARGWDLAGRFGPVFFCVVMTTALWLTSAWGPPPWPSRFVGPFGARCGHSRRPALVVIGMLTAAFAAAVPVTTGSSREIYLLIAAALIELLVMAAAFALRFWRFAPGRRSREALALVVIGVVALAVYLPLAFVADWCSVVIAAVCVAATIRIAWPLAVVDPTRSRS